MNRNERRHSDDFRFIYTCFVRTVNNSGIIKLLHCCSGPGQRSRYSNSLYGLDGPGIESRWVWNFPHPSRPALGPTQPPIQRVPGLSRGQSGRGVALTTHPHLAPMLRKSTAIHLFHFWAFVACFRVNYTFNFTFIAVWVKFGFSFSVSLLFERWAYVGYAPGSSDWRISHLRDVTWMNK